VLCVGKALGGGLPLSAALFVRPDLEQVWDFGDEDLYTHTHSGNPLACAAALVVLEEVPKLLPRVAALADRFAAAGWDGRGLLRAKATDWTEAMRRGVLVIPVPPDLAQAAPPFTLDDDELEEALVKLARS
jgi:acetylornithine/succinyldiaminopimelate/putrescine aminotransferase